MLKPFHLEMTRLALGEKFSSRALEAILAANVYQDRLRGQIGHPEYHFDDNAFEKSYAYLEEQRTLTVSALMTNSVSSAWSAFGRLTHAAQDFYAHSNYIDLWLSIHTNGTVPTPSEVNPLDTDLIDSGALRSGKVYVRELLIFIPVLKLLGPRLLPRDAHGWMNIDSPARGPSFDYAFQAAVKRTRIEFQKTTKDLPQDLLTRFLDK